MTDDFIDPTPEGRRKLLWLIAAALVAGAVATYWLLPWFRTQMQVLPPCEALRLARGVMTAMLLGLPLIVVLWALPLARGMWRTGQFPLPDAWVLRRTRVQRGRAVRVRAVALLVCTDDGAGGRWPGACTSGVFRSGDLRDQPVG